MRIILVVALLALAGCTEDTPTHDDGCEDAADHDACHAEMDGMDDSMDDGMEDGMGDGMDGSSNETERRAPVTWDIDVADNSFSPADLTIQVGDTVRWTQSGSNPHTVTEDDAAWDSHPDCAAFQDSLLGNCMAEGDSYEVTFDTAGSVGYYCKIHGSSMAGSITVEDRWDPTPS